MTGTVEGPNWITLFITWTEASQDVHCEAYGPWRVQEDDAHFYECHAFLAAWHARAGDKKMIDATVHLITSPEQFAARP